MIIECIDELSVLDETEVSVVDEVVVVVVEEVLCVVVVVVVEVVVEVLCVVVVVVVVNELLWVDRYIKSSLPVDTVTNPFPK